MENKLNKPALENYAGQVTSKICAGFFNDEKMSITGDEVLGLTPIPQANYFILKNLFFKWKEEITALKKSPYFNYENAEVEASLKSLMNALSNHIVIKRKNFEPLLSSAIEETIYLALSPYHYFKHFLFYPEKLKISLAELREQARYIKINSLFFNEFIKTLESYKIDSFIIADILGYFQQAYYNNNEKFDAFEPVINEFSRIVPLNLHTIVVDLKKKSDVAPTPLEVFENRKKVSEQDIPSNVATNITPIKLGINQRIMFLKELFKADEDLMNVTLARLESAGNYQNAKYIISFFDWDQENEAVQEFMEILDAKFK